jgi:hypothetical protein
MMIFRPRQPLAVGLSIALSPTYTGWAAFFNSVSKRQAPAIWSGLYALA